MAKKFVEVGRIGKWPNGEIEKWLITNWKYGRMERWAKSRLITISVAVDDVVGGKIC